jgi:DHA1 family multidrug resistance protein-like MFS transporter
MSQPAHELSSAQPAQDAPGSRYWKRNLIVLFFGEMISLAGFSVVLPFLPYYAQYLGVTGDREIQFWAAALTTAQAVTMAAVAPVWGSLADRYGRKIMVERAMFGGAVVIAAMGFVGNVYQLAILRAIQGTLTGTVPAATTLVVSSAPPRRRGYALGMLQMAIYLGLTAGPLLGGLIADAFGPRIAFWVTGSLLFVSGVLILTLVREDFSPPETVDAQRPSSAGCKRASKPRLWDGILLVLHTRALLTAYGLRVLTRMAGQIVGPMLVLYVQSIASPGTKVASLTGIIAGFASATSALGAVLMGRLTDRIGSRRVLIACAGLACVILAAQALAQTPMQLLAWRTAGGFALGGILASVSALQASLAPKGRYGAVYGVDTSLSAAANAVSPMIGAALSTTFGLPSVFVGAAVIYGLTVALTAFAVPKPAEE